MLATLVTVSKVLFFLCLSLLSLLLLLRTIQSAESANRLWAQRTNMAEEKWTIEKLNGSNWVTWKFQMKLAKELWTVVDGSETLAEGAELGQTLRRSVKRHFLHWL